MSPVCTLVWLRWEETSPGVQKTPLDSGGVLGIRMCLTVQEGNGSRARKMGEAQGLQ